MANGMPPEAGKGAAAPASGRAESAKVSEADLVADAPSEYTVVKGDTLWGISGRFLKDPWKWPYIWQMNQEQIKNPHLIYPGDVIKLDREALRLSIASGGAGGVGMGGSQGEAAANVVKVEPRVRVEPLQMAIPSIPGTVIGPFLSQPLVVEVGGLDAAPTILATEESRVIIGAGDTAYADRIGTDDGVNWQVFRPGVALTDPDSGEVLGYEAKYVGDARVRRFGNPTTLHIVKARQEINRGDRLTPAREATYPTYVPRAPDKPIVGSIMSVDGGVSEFGQYQIITINRGARDGLEVGHVLAAYRRGAEIGGRGGREITFKAPGWFSGLYGAKPNPVVPDPPNLQPVQAPSGEKVVGVAQVGTTVKLPDERTGLIFVFRVFDKLSYALVMRSTHPIYIGDVVRTP
ncbi:MAG TPA: LysM peptidoglycan-binding domain-containing protein [Usitatibacter sp.]|nr:LysM peptidoglycan-binding domain-containing protein [Usitatibacter sp.]